MIFRKKNQFTNKIVLKKCSTASVNPARGWYSLFPFTLPENPDFNALTCCLNPAERLALVRICIGNYQNAPLDENALTLFQEILAFFAAHQKEMILRIVYDDAGNGLQKEPSSLSLIKLHMEQLGAIIQTFSAHIYTTQGIFIGSWGEMHTSRFLSSREIAELIFCFYTATAGSVHMAVRTPVQLRGLETELSSLAATEIRSDILSLTGLYNDAITASETDYGTYGSADSSFYTKSWNRNAELQFQQTRCQTVYNGGEVVNPNPYNDTKCAISTLRTMHISYLNSQYDRAVLEKWKTQENTLEYISDHLGYCLLLYRAELEKKEHAMLNIFIRNTGFASLYEHVRLHLSAKDSAGTYTVLSSQEIPQIFSDETVCFSCPLTTLSKGAYQLSCSLERIKTHEKLSFYNPCTLGTLFIV